MKKIAVETAKKFLKENTPEHVAQGKAQLADGTEIAFEIRTHLTTEEKSTFIHRVLSGCFDAQGDYRPEYMTPMLRATILQMCTNLPALSLKGVQTTDGEAAMDIEAMNNLYVALNMDATNSAEYQNMMGELVYLCNVAADWRKARTLSGTNEALSAAAEGVRELMAALLTKLDGFDLEGLTEYAAKLSKATEGMSEKQLVAAIIENGVGLKET